MEEKLVVIDTDSGVDDALAIFLCLAAHKDPTNGLRVIGIICVNGNTGIDNVCRNVTRILHVAGVLDIPIYRGCGQPMVIPLSQRWSHHGSDGFGDANLEPIEPNIEHEHGVLALIRLAELHKGQLNILAIGPLTNLAMAVRLEPTIKEFIKTIFIMGGNVQGENGEPHGGFNFTADPESAHVTLSSYSCPITIVPLEACRRPQNNLKDLRLELGQTLVTGEMTLLNQIERDLETKQFYLPCDFLTAAVLVEPKIIQQFESVYAQVELRGNLPQGYMTMNPSQKDGHHKNVHVVHSARDDLVKKLFAWSVGGPHN